MNDVYNLPDAPNPSVPTPFWVKLSLGGPFLAFLLSVLILQGAEMIPSLAGPAQALFLISSVSAALGFGAVLVACLAQLFRKTWRSTRAAQKL
jgi:hypothetical protein